MEDVATLPGGGQPPPGPHVGKETAETRGEAADVDKRGRPEETVADVQIAGVSAREGGSSDMTRGVDEAGTDAGTGSKEGITTRGSRIVDALRPAGRKRKGSLRQGLLGKNMLRRGPPRSQRAPTHTLSIANNTHMAETTSEDETTPRPVSHEQTSRIPTADREQRSSAASLFSASTARSSSYELEKPTRDVLPSAARERVAVPYASTTDDDEAVSFSHRSVSSGSSYDTSSLQLASASLHRRASRATQRTSLSTVQSPTDLALDEDWDYSETEWWGWIILIGTWIVFVVGMGSCLGVWSWAWDVGETPYAPPELEDDPTLPITGYYPALIVCTAVMAWVWVVVAWVGMKYFRHSKMVSDDS